MPVNCYRISDSLTVVHYISSCLSARRGWGGQFINFDHVLNFSKIQEKLFTTSMNLLLLIFVLQKLFPFPGNNVFIVCQQCIPTAVNSLLTCLTPIMSFTRRRRGDIRHEDLESTGEEIRPRETIEKESRSIHINSHQEHKFSSNEVMTAKYNVITFLPKFLFEQFRRYANVFFLVIGLLQQV